MLGHARISTHATIEAREKLHNAVISQTRLIDHMGDKAFNVPCCLVVKLELLRIYKNDDISGRIAEK